ncbi:MAG: branched-chain-amino acid aminotransferase [Myxococcales bacterium]|nr:branched-chain-amino acid aminotransferase [Myxococcales bacterium]
MSTRIYLNGSITGPEDAKISIFDRGFLYGDSVYEVMRTSGGQLVDLDRHLMRLYESASALALPPPQEDVLRKAIVDTLASAGNEESYVRLVVTRGSGEVGLDTALAELPTTLVIAKPLVLPTASMYSGGVRVRLVNVQRTSAKAMDPSVKSGNYLNNIMALAEAKRAGDYEAIMCDRDGLLAEGSSSNVFFVEGTRLLTPNLSVGLLAGITRQRVLEIAEGLGVAVEQGRFGPERLRDASEAFLTSSIRGVLAITAVDGEPLPTAAPGPMGTRVMQAYAAFLEEEALG